MSLADALIDPSLTAAPKVEDIEMNPSENGGGEDSDAATAEDDEMQDLFGEDATPVEENVHDDPTTPASSEHLDGITSPERKHRDAMEYPEEDEPEAIVEQVLEANAAIPNIPIPKSSDGNHWVIRMPNFVKLDSKPFHTDTYIGPEHEDEDTTAESLREKSMSIKLKVENTVRWRWVKNAQGQDQRQSNSRIIRWSDGTLSLKLGKELFDITSTVDTSGTVPRQSFGPSQSQSQGTLTPSQSQTLPSGKIPAQGLTYLVAQHKRAEILQCEAVVTGYMSLRPTGMQSETHRMLVRAVGQKHSKVARLRMGPDPTMDPEREKMELLKQAAKKPRKSRGEDDGLGGIGGLGGRKRRSGYSRKRSGEDMWSDDDEDGDGYGGNGAGGSEDEYGMESGDRGGKRRKSEENPRKGPGEYQTDDFVVSDSDEEGGHGDGGGSKKKRRQRHEDENEAEGEEDDLEKLEAQLDQQQAEERKRKEREAASSSGAGPGNAGGDEDTEDGGDAMDVESEEEEEYGVRRAGGVPGVRKKRAIEAEDEEEE